MAKQAYRRLSPKEIERRQRVQDDINRFLLAQSRRDATRRTVLRLENELHRASGPAETSTIKRQLVQAQVDRDQAQKAYDQTNPKFHRNAFTGRTVVGPPSSDYSARKTAMIMLAPFTPIIAIIVVAIVRWVF